jgi:hypothetical protein
MAIYFIDYVNGSDAAAGTSWATAWKTCLTGATAARIAPGDEIRIAKSPDPTSIGTATWTSGKVGNSITFSSAPTKLIDPAKAGWVTMGAGSVVTNGNTNAYMTPISFGGVINGALQWVTTATANGALKDLGSTIDFSAHQQVSFWFRSTVALDCTGAQNLLVDLCSDAGATAVVSALTAPKWNYQANIWYPIVIDLGSALSSTVRSIRFRTTNATSQTFYVDEIFASPAAGLTLWSLIGLNDNDWYPIRTCRDADVQLLAAYAPGTATGASGNANTLDLAWMGTTVTATTYKRETIKAWTPAGVTTGPGAYSGVQCTEVGTNLAPDKYIGGWNTSSGAQDGYTFIDNLTHFSGSIGFNQGSFANILFSKIAVVRFATGQSGTAASVYKNVSFIGTGGVALPATANPSRQLLATLGETGYTIDSIIANSSNITLDFTTPAGVVSTFGNFWGNQNTHIFQNARGANLTIGNIYTSYNATGAVGIVSCLGTNFKFGDIKGTPTNVAAGGGNTFGSISAVDCVISAGDLVGSGPSVATGIGSITGSNLVFNFKSFTSNGYFLATSNSGANIVFNIPSISYLVFASGSAHGFNTKFYFHNYNGATDYFRAYVFDNSSTTHYFDLDGTDVYTAGSKAVRFVGGSISLDNAYGMFDLKLASAAAEANKLVTITARVKRNTVVDAGIYIPGLAKLVPGYTADISTQCTTTGAYELLTLTFTPTANCVFDVMAFVRPTAVGTPDVRWDALTISQAA